MVWDGIIACYLFLAGLGAGAFAFAALVRFVKPEAMELRRIGYIMAPIAVGVGTLLLMVDAKAGLMNPLRFFALVTNLSSIMAWGVIILMAFMAVSIVVAILVLMKKSVPMWLDIAGLVCAVAVAMYTGMLLGDAPGFPLWNPFVLPLLFLVSATSSGFAAVVLVAHIMKIHDVDDISFLKKTGLAFPVAEAVLIAVLLGVTASTAGSSSVGAHASVANLISGSYAVLFWLGLVGIGLIFPFVVEVMQASKVKKTVAVPSLAAAGAGEAGVVVESGNAKDKAKSQSGLAMAGEAGVLVGGFLLRFLIIMAALPVSLM